MKQYESDQLRVERRVAAQRARERGERLERIATPVFAAMINASPHVSAHVLAKTAADFAKALIAELDKQA